MIDPVLTEMHKIKEANGKRYMTVEALAKGLVVRERATIAQGRATISLPLRPNAQLRTRATRRKATA